MYVLLPCRGEQAALQIRTELRPRLDREEQGCELARQAEKRDHRQHITGLRGTVHAAW